MYQTHAFIFRQECSAPVLCGQALRYDARRVPTCMRWYAASHRESRSTSRVQARRKAAMTDQEIQDIFGFVKTLSDGYQQ